MDTEGKVEIEIENLNYICSPGKCILLVLLKLIPIAHKRIIDLYLNSSANWKMDTEGKVGLRLELEFTFVSQANADY